MAPLISYKVQGAVCISTVGAFLYGKKLLTWENTQAL